METSVPNLGPPLHWSMIFSNKYEFVIHRACMDGARLVKDWRGTRSPERLELARRAHRIVNEGIGGGLDNAARNVCISGSCFAFSLACGHLHLQTLEHALFLRP